MAVLLAAAVLVFNIDVVRDWFRGYVDVVALVPGTSGVRVGSPVYVGGIEAGRVTAVDVVDMGTQGAIALHLRLEDRVASVVRRGSLASTLRRNFIGEPLVTLSPGPAESSAVQPGDTLYPDRPVTLDTLLARGRSLGPALDSLVAAADDVQRLAGERSSDVEALLNRLAAATEEATVLRSQLEGGSLGKWLEDPTFDGRIDQLSERVASLSEAAAGLRRYGDPEMRRSVAAVAQRADRLTASIEELERRLEAGEGVLGRMQRDSAIAVALKRVQAQIDSLRAEGLGFALRMVVP